MRENFFRLLMWVLSRSPVFCITFDKYFHNLPWKKGEVDYPVKRFSLFSLGFGSRKFYFMTLENPKFSFLKVLNYAEASGYDLGKIKKEVDRKTEEYKAEKFDEEKREEHKEFLIYKIQQELDRIQTATNKIAVYIGALLIFLPINFSNETTKNLDFPTIAIAIIAIYSYINAALWGIDYLKVDKTIRSKFNALRKQNTDALYLYYKDYQYIQEEANYCVSYVRNQERYIKGFFLSYVILQLYEPVLEYIICTLGI